MHLNANFNFISNKFSPFVASLLGHPCRGPFKPCLFNMTVVCVINFIGTSQYVIENRLLTIELEQCRLQSSNLGPFLIMPFSFIYSATIVKEFKEFWTGLKSTKVTIA